MLSLVVLTLGLIVAVGVIGIIFNSFLFQRTRTQYQVDALAMSVASTINAGNRVGQLNELEAHCRELVFVSRNRTENYAEDDMSFLTPLSNQLLEEARAGQGLVERERQNQIQLITKEVRQAASGYNLVTNRNGGFSLNWLQTTEPKVTRVDLGRIDGIESNVRSQPVISELADFDSRQGYVHGASKLFRAHTNAKLPGVDGDLDFKFSALPAFVGRTCAPPRNANPDVFVSYGSVFENGQPVPSAVQHIPNAVQIFSSMDVSIGTERLNKKSVDLNSVGTASGAVSDTE